jgi:hypothetical protein
MNMLWQLKKLSTNETLNEPQKLPENWGPIFGMGGIKDRLGDLSWLGDAYADQGWVEVGPAPDSSALDKTAVINAQIEHFLQESNWMVAGDNTSVSKNDRVLWIEYRQALREIPNQSGFPEEVYWPTKPE